MIATKIEIKDEAINRIKALIKKCNLNPDVLKYFHEGKVYYSYLTMGGFMGSIDTISFEKDYEQAVKEFEKMHPNYLVYHAIESITKYGKLLSLLYVSDDKEEWESERIERNNSIMSYVLNFDIPDYSELGYIIIDGYMESGALVRVDVISEASESIDIEMVIG